MMNVPLIFWLGFNVAVLALLALDLTVFYRGNARPSVRKLLATTVGWIAVAALFGGWVILHAGPGKGLEFFTGYLIEYALSLDNVFLFVLIFTTFGTDPAHQRRVLFWGVLGALIMRGVMILAGSALLGRFEWLFYFFGAYIVYAGAGLFFQRKHAEVENQLVVRLARRTLPLSRDRTASRFVVREDGRRKFTLLFLVLVVIEFTDLVFALDSIPAVFGVTLDPFIVYTSNVCAILGLRSLYFLLERAVRSLVYLQMGLAVVLVFIGGKMLVKDFVVVPTGVSLLVVAGVLIVAVGASLVKSASNGKDSPAHP